MSITNIAQEAVALYESYGNDDVYANGCFKSLLEAWLSTETSLRPHINPESYAILSRDAHTLYSEIVDGNLLEEMTKVSRPSLLYVLSADDSQLARIRDYHEQVLPIIEQLCPQSVQSAYPTQTRMDIHKHYSVLLAQLLMTARLVPSDTNGPQSTTRLGRRFKQLLRRYYQARGRTITQIVIRNRFL